MTGLITGPITTQTSPLKPNLILFTFKIQLLDLCSKASPTFIAIVEECFPSEAMTDPEVFYACQRIIQSTLAKHAQIMMDSCEKFIDFNKIEVIPTSRYRII